MALSGAAVGGGTGGPASAAGVGGTRPAAARAAAPAGGRGAGGAGGSRIARCLAELLGATDDETTRELAAVLEVLADHALVWPDGTGQLRMAGPLRQAWDAPLGLDAPLEHLLAGTTSDELRGMLVALGLKSPGTKAQRLAALVEHHSDPERIAALVAKAPAAARELLERRAVAAPEEPPQFIVFGASWPDLEADGARWALDRGLLVQDRHRYGPVRMPVEVALGAAGPRLARSVRTSAARPAVGVHHLLRRWSGRPRSRPPRSRPMPPRSFRRARPLRRPG